MGDVEIKDDASRSYGHFCLQVRDGEFNHDVTSELKGLLMKLEEQALAVGKAKGELTVTLKFNVDMKGNVRINTDCKVKAPKPITGEGHMWLLKGRLSAESPRQLKLGELREVPPPAVKEVPAAPATEVR